jgi:CRISPR/Cas system-associated protein Csm6
LLDADVVLDQLLLGSYGVVAVQAMLAGRLVLAHVHERVRARIDQELPIVEVTPDTLGQVLERVVTDRASYAATAAEGAAYAGTVHDGRRSAQVLADFLGTSSG